MRCSWTPLFAWLVLGALLLYGHDSVFARTGERHPATVAVSIENYAFQPDPLTIAVGTTVRWTNRDEVLHTVVSNDKLFSSPELQANQHFEFTFKKAGTFAYFCTLHPEMKGKVIVQ